MQVLSKQRGVAIVTALLLASLAITLVMSLFGEQNVQIRSIENQRFQLQKQWVMRGAIDWARLILREEARSNQADYLGEPWSVPLKETRLDQYVDNGKTSEEETNAILSGYITDAQSFLNLTNLARNGVIDQASLAAFEKLLTAQSIDPILAQAVAEMVVSTQAKGAQLSDNGEIKKEGATARMIALTQVDDLLAVPGFTQEVVDNLKKFVVFLPMPTPVNINTASAQVIAAQVEGLSLSEAEQLIASREQAHFRSLIDLEVRWLAQTPFPPVGVLNTQSNYFIVHGHVELDRTALDADVLVERKPLTGATRIVWIREY